MKAEIKTRLADIAQRQLQVMNDVYAICRHADENPDDMTDRELGMLSSVYEDAETAHGILVELEKRT